MEQNIIIRLMENLNEKAQRILGNREHTIDELHEIHDDWTSLNDKIRDNNLEIEAINEVIREYAKNSKLSHEDKNEAITGLQKRAESLNIDNGPHAKKAKKLHALLRNIHEDVKNKLAEKIVLDRYQNSDWTTSYRQGGSKKKRNKRRKSRKKIIKKLKKSKSIKKH
jgi:hypothetical protein